MSLRRATALAVVVLVHSVSSRAPADATPGAPGIARVGDRISPEIAHWFRSPAFRMVRGSALPGGSAAALRLRRVGVSIRLDRAESLARLQSLEGTSLSLRR